MAKLYEGYTQEALIMSSGDWEKADYLLDCTWYEYLWRKNNSRLYGEWYEKEMKAVTGRS